MLFLSCKFVESFKIRIAKYRSACYIYNVIFGVLEIQGDDRFELYDGPV